VLALCAALVFAVLRSGRALDEPAQQTRRLALRVGLAALFWLALSGAISASGVLARPMLPPPLALFASGSMVLAVALACSPFGKRLAAGLPIAALIAVQAFRLPLELVLHSCVGGALFVHVLTFRALLLNEAQSANYARTPRSVS
jgi:hypothetical protein